MADFIRRSKRKNNFTTVNNDYLQDVNLSWKAKGLITYIMSLPDDWQLNISDLKNRSKDGRDATSNGINELIDNHYCLRRKQRNPGGMFLGYNYTVSDVKEFVPETGNPFTDPETENTNTGNPVTEKQNTENTELLNTNTTKNSLEDNTNSIVVEKEFSPTETLFPESDFINPKENKEKKVAQKKETADRVTLFSNSEVCKLVDLDNKDYSEFEKLFPKDFDKFDLVYYFHSVSDWSDQKNMKRTKKGWIATVRTFIRGDVDKQKAKLKPEFQQGKEKINLDGAIEFLTGYD